MWTRLKHSVAELMRAPPGERFIARHRSWRACGNEHYLATATYCVVGALAIALGIVFAFSPVLPGFVFVLAGLAVLSARFGWLAYRLDRLELACRRLMARRRPAAQAQASAKRGGAGEGGSAGPT